MVEVSVEIDLDAIDRIVEKSGSNPEALIGVLQDIQSEWNYLPIPALKYVSEKLDVPYNRVWAVATFYEAFSLAPHGGTHLMVCTGTTCHVRGNREIIQTIESELGVKCGYSTPDGKYSLDSVHCLGACAVGPMVVVDGEFHGQMTVDKLKDLLKNLLVKRDGDSS